MAKDGSGQGTKNLGSVFHQGNYCCVPSCRWQKTLASRLEAKGFFAYPSAFPEFFLLDVFFLEDVDCAGWYQGRIPNKNKSQCCVVG